MGRRRYVSADRHAAAARRRAAQLRPDGVVGVPQDRRGHPVTPRRAHSLLWHVDRVRGRHSALHAYGPGTARRDRQVRPGLTAIACACLLDITRPNAATIIGMQASHGDRSAKDCGRAGDKRCFASETKAAGGCRTVGREGRAVPGTNHHCGHPSTAWPETVAPKTEFEIAEADCARRWCREIPSLDWR